MKITVELNESDICQIIAEHYNNLTQEDVNLFVTKEMRGYGPGEYEANVVKAKIEFDSEGEAGACLR